ILDTGDVGFIDNVDGKGGYTYNIEAGQTFRIPMPTVNDTSPVFTGISNQRITAEKLFTYQLSAKSVSGKKLTYTPVSVPSGVTVSPTGLIKWTPSGAQVGFNPLAIMVSDGIMSSTARFTVEVLNSTDGGGGGTGPGPGPGPKPDPDEKPKPDTQFKDLAGYDWASDAINKLAKDGIIKGVSEDEFAPENDITRADFVILMVRALKLESTATDNFADVGADDYFARELAIAKANGIITGFGDNLFNPRGKITRQDMMTIMARALQKSGYKLDTATQGALDAFADSDDIAEYAREAAALLVKNGIIAGNDGRLNPTANTTRAEVAVLLSRVLYPTK
ncbi:MAG: S-layer homology domain-containing protein, partial [Clostridia bacterium]